MKDGIELFLFAYLQKAISVPYIKAQQSRLIIHILLNTRTEIVYDHDFITTVYQHIDNM
jgi:hypothetical protein